jgi:hypothetical protein
VLAVALGLNPDLVLDLMRVSVTDLLAQGGTP